MTLHLDTTLWYHGFYEVLVPKQYLFINVMSMYSFYQYIFPEFYCNGGNHAYSEKRCTSEN